MANHTQTQTQTTAASANGRGAGFVVFAAVLMLLGGTFQILEGITAIVHSNFYLTLPNYIVQFDISTWGWIHTIVGIIAVLAGFGLFTGATWARVIGIILALLSAIANFFWIPYYPFWSIVVIAIDVGIIWGLSVWDSNTYTT